MVGLFAANPRAFRIRLGRCGFSAAIPTRKERAGTWLLVFWNKEFTKKNFFCL
jgi:hypothetical protein